MEPCNISTPIDIKIYWVFFLAGGASWDVSDGTKMPQKNQK